MDYFVVNISSPNTPGLRSLQEKEPLKKILKVLLDHRQSLSVRKPILLKIAPDLTAGQLIDVVNIVKEMEIEGMIVSNTTIDRSNLRTSDHKIEEFGSGGLSGQPLFKNSTEMIKAIHTQTQGAIPIIGVGGISSGYTANEKVNAGATLVQVYSGLIYEGPFLIKKIKKYLSRQISLSKRP